MAERIDRARVLELLFDDGLDVSDCDSDEDNEDQVFSYPGDELLRPWGIGSFVLSCKFNSGCWTLCWRDFVTTDEENEYEKDELLGKCE